MFKNSFWGIMKRADWSEEEAQNILQPIIDYLAVHSDKYIFEFHDLMTYFLHELDKKSLAQHLIDEGNFDEEKFLYQRCFVLSNDNRYYHDIVHGIKKMPENQFKPILNIPKKAWAKKNKQNITKYPHTPKYPIQTKSNDKYWK